jgi:hypothetical protein
MNAEVRRGFGEWFGAIFAAVTVGAVVGLGCACVAAIWVHLSDVSLEALRISSYAIAAFAGIATSAHFLWLFSHREMEVRDIWRSFGKFLTAFGKETPP